MTGRASNNPPLLKVNKKDTSSNAVSSAQIKRIGERVENSASTSTIEARQIEIERQLFGEP